MKKKLSLIVCLVLMVTIFVSGCSLFQRNNDNYYSQTVATAGSDITLTKEELIEGVNRYASTLVNNYNYSSKDAVDYVVNMLVNQKILLKDAKSKFTLSDDEKKQVMLDAYDVINGNMEYFEDKVKDSWGIEDEDDSEKEPTYKVYEEYGHQAEVYFDEDLDEYVIRRIEEEEDYSGLASLEKTVEAFFDKMAESRSIDFDAVPLSIETKVFNEAKIRLIKQLKTNEEGRTFKGKNAYSDNAVLFRAIEKAYEDAEESMYLSKLNKYIGNSNDVSVEQVLNDYKSKVLGSYAKYEYNPTSYDEDVKNSASTIYHYPQSSETIDEYFYVTHILVKFNETQQSLADNLKTKLEQTYISQEDYDLQMASLVSQISKAKIIDGEATDDVYTINQIYSNLQTDLNGLTGSEKLQKFNEYIYMFNEDDGVFNSETPYVVGMKNSQMVESFTTASRELNTASAIGGISGIVPSQYGAHIIIYCGKLENEVNFASASDFVLENNDILKLNAKKLNPCTSKTYFDVCYENVYSDSYSTRESLYVNNLKKDLDIKIYKKAYKDLLR